VDQEQRLMLGILVLEFGRIEDNLEHERFLRQLQQLQQIYPFDFGVIYLDFFDDQRNLFLNFYLG